MRSLQRILATTALLAAFVVAVQSGAHATPPDRFVEEAEFSRVFTDCSQYPERGSDALILASGTLRRSVTVRYEDGEPAVEVRHIRFEGVLTGPGGSVPYDGTGKVTVDLRTNELTLTGAQVRIWLSDGLVVFAGRTVVNFDTMEVFDTPHTGDPGPAVCSAIG
jgi:hypothetical protein